jgi:hypothetical protein
MGNQRLKEIIKRQSKELELFHTSDAKLADMIDPRVFADALKEFGWVELPDNGFNAIILQAHEKGKLFQVNIPKGKHLGDFVFTMIYSAKEVALYLNQDVKQVLVELALATVNQKSTEKQ